MLATQLRCSSRQARGRGHSTQPGTGRGQTVCVRASVPTATVAPGDLVLVAGSTGGVGQLVTAKLLERGFKVRAVDRGNGRAAKLFPGADIQVVKADLRDPSSLGGLMDGVSAVCCCTGTTAFPSSRWEGNNGPRPTDWDAVRNLVDAAPAASTRRFVLVTSVGVERVTQLPWAILNTFGVLHYKRMSESYLAASGVPYTVIRPGRLTDGPYTSYDLNTLLKATSGSRQDVQLSANDDQSGEASRIAVAEAVVQSLLLPGTANRFFSLCSKEGDGPSQDTAKWSSLFSGCYEPARAAARA